MNCKLTIEQICTITESPLFDRKSARIDAKTLAIHLIAFANADGGVIAVGVEDDGTITGIDAYQEHINELLRVPFDYCKPSVQIETELLACTNKDGKPDHILLIEVLQSNELHANQADDVFFRVGDKSKKLNFDERLHLMYAKGTRYFEDTPVPDAAMEDIDLDFVREYTQKLGYRKSPEEYLRENKEFISTKGGKEEVSTAAMLLFGKNPKHYFPRARIRFVLKAFVKGVRGYFSYYLRRFSLCFCLNNAFQPVLRSQTATMVKKHFDFIICFALLNHKNSIRFVFLRMVILGG